MPIISWDENKPAGQDSLGIGDDQIRSDKSALRTAIDTEHVFPSTGGDAGVHRLGSARPFYAAQSLVSSTGSDGRLMATSDTSRLFGVGSGGTVLYGGPTVLSAGSFPGGVAPQRFYWAIEFGIGQTRSGATTIGFPNSGFSGSPFVILQSINDGISTSDLVWTQQASKTDFNVLSTRTNGASASSTSFYWLSIGSRVL